MSTALDDRVIAAYARTAGFTGDALVTAVAVALAESGGQPGVLGDTGLVTDKWGPSVGLWQIRSLQEQRGSGDVRDQLANLNPAHNADAAFAISGGGRNWQPWSVFTSGGYRQYLERARAAARGMEAGVPMGSVASQIGTQLGGKAGDVAGGIADALNPFDDILGGIGRIVLTGVFVAGGVALVVIGGHRAVTSRGAG